MGHSIQECDGRYLVLNDADLMAVVSLSNGIADSSGGVKFKSIIALWNEAVETAGPGTIDLKFDALTQGGSREDLRDLMGRLKVEIGSFGEVVPARALQRWRAIAFNDSYPSRLLTDTVDKIEKFLD